MQRMAPDIGSGFKSRLIVFVVGAMLGPLIWSASAHALLQRGHTFAGTTIGSEGSGPGQLREPSAVAVDEATGELYVADRGNNRVETFGADGEFGVVFESAKGANISHPEAIAVDNSHQADPADDPSAGDVYVAQKNGVFKFSAEGKYLSTLVGKALVEELGTPLGVAVDTRGQVWVDFAEDGILRFDDGAPNTRVGDGFEATLEYLRSGLAVDAEDNLYVRYEPGEEAEAGARGCKHAPCLIGKLSSSEEPARELSPGEPLVKQVDHEDASGVAVDTSDDDVYVDNLSSVAAFDSAGALIQRFGSGPLRDGSGVGVDAKTDVVYVADAADGEVIAFDPATVGAPTVDSAATSSTTTTSAKLEAQIDPHGAPTSYTLQYSTTRCTAGPSTCAESFRCAAPASVCGEVPSSPTDLGEAFGTQATPTALVDVNGLTPNTVYYYRFVARNANGLGTKADQSFLTLSEGGPVTADGRDWEQVSPVDKFGNAIEPITFEGGAVQASSDGAALAYLASGPVTATPEGARPPEATQVLSTRNPASGWTSQDITTPNAEASGVETGKDKGEYLLFSPNLSLSAVEPFDANRFAAPPLTPPLTQREEDEGQETTLYLRADSPIAPEPAGQTIYEAAQANGRLLSQPGYVALVSDLNAPGVELDSAPYARTLQFEGATPDLTHVVLASSVALGEPEAGSRQRRIYEWSAGSLQNVSVLPEGEDAEGEAPNGEAPQVKGLEPGLGLGVTGSASSNVRHAISNDGSRVFWSATAENFSGKRLYMRDTQAGQTTRIDVPTAPGFVASGESAPRFQTASADGGEVFFTDTQELVPGSEAYARGGEEKPDLYVYDVAAKKLTDLTLPPPRSKEAADVLGIVPGASESGDYVYFVANGVLDASENPEGEKASPGACTAHEVEGANYRSKCNLYVAHFNGASWERPRFIAALSSEDGPDWVAESQQNFRLTKHTSGTSPDGDYLAFMSNRSLTGYDNTDAVSGQPDEEVFLYDASANRLVCASCNPTGARPHGVHDVEQSSEGIGLLVDRPESWTETSEDTYSSWLAASIPGWTTASSVEDLAFRQPNYLSDSGRLYFNSADSLVPQDTNGKEDVYEYEPEGVPKGAHTCTSSTTTFSAAALGCIGLISSGSSDLESAFLDASARGGEEADGSDGEEGGGDVFFVTAAPLVVQDTDTTFDAYDAHECTTASPCLPPQRSESGVACGSEASCKQPFAPASASFPSPASGASSGNLGAEGGVLANKVSTTAKPKPLTRSQKLKRALRSCRKLKRKARRRACERRARERYGAKRAKRPSRSGGARK